MLGQNSFVNVRSVTRSVSLNLRMYQTGLSFMTKEQSLASHHAFLVFKDVAVILEVASLLGTFELNPQYVRLMGIQLKILNMLKTDLGLILVSHGKCLDESLQKHPSVFVILLVLIEINLDLAKKIGSESGVGKEKSTVVENLAAE